MKTYDLYLDSGPMKKKTYVHVPQLLGCIARGDTSDAAVEHSPDAIRAFLAFCARAGERVDPGAAFRARVAEHHLAHVPRRAHHRDHDVGARRDRAR